jgi:hypothetical protein
MLSSEERALCRLYQAGFAEKEVARLRQRRSTYSAEQDKRASQAEYHRWQCAPYLVATGKLTKQDA